MKKCNKCGKIKPFSAFCRNKATRDRRHAWCRNCAAKYQQEYQQKHCKQLAKQHRDYYKTVNGYLRHIFNAAKQRCNNPKYTGYKYYGGRGIKFLFKSFDEFYNHIVNELQIDPRGLQIDRINNDGHYEKGNIRFVTAKENSNNRNKRQYKIRRKL